MMAGRYKAYSKYKETGVEWTGLIPKHWTLKRIKDTANLINGFPFDSKKFETNKGMPLVRIRDINSKNTQVGFTGSVPDESLINDGDILIGMDGDFNVALWSGGVAALNQRVACIRADSELLQKYIYYILPFNMKVINDLTYFTTVKHLSNIDILKTVYPSPPTNELCNIVNFLDHETAKIDTLIAKQEKLIELLKEKRQAVISHAVTKGLNPDAPMKDSGVEWLGEVPEHWTFIPNKRLFELTPKKSQVESKKDLSCSFIPMDKLKQDSLVLDEEKVIASVFDGYTYFENEDILMAKVTPCFENKNMVVARGMKNGIGFGSSEIYVLRCNDKVINDFMYYRLQEDIFMNIAIAAMTGAGGLKRVPAHVITSFVLALPPIEEQLKIVNSLKEKLKIFDVLSVKATGAIELMKERKTALISAAVTGKVDVRSFNFKEQGHQNG